MDGPAVLRSAADVARAVRAELDARRERVLILICDVANRLRRSVVVYPGDDAPCSLEPARRGPG